ncbi:MAG: translocation/assembly module TamB domain-containing protein, partial [Rhodospirillales bacterium]|nr:translocation/assembly module TamB domain-containing protein [Rhodospirillales bacterium]
TIAAARASADVRRAATLPQGTWQLDANTGLGHWDASSRFAVTAADAVDVRELKVRGPATALSGQLTIPLATGPTIGQITGRFAALETPARFGEMRAGGRADLALSLTAERGQQAANLEVAGRALVLTQTDDTTIRFQRLDGRLTGRLELGAETAEFTISLADPMGHNGEAAANGRLSRVGNAWHLDVTKLAGQIDNRRFALDKSFNAQIEPGAVSVSPFVLRLAGGRVTGDGRWQADGALDGRLTATALPLSLIGLALPAAPSLDGSVDLRLSARNVGTRLVAEAGSEIKGGGRGVGAAFQLRTQGRLDNGGLDLRAEGTGPGGASVNASIQLPLALSTRDFRPLADIDPPLAGSLQARADLAKLTAALGVDGHAVSGDFAADITIAGTLAAPRPSGSFGVNDLRYENFLTGTILDGGTLDGRFAGDDALRLTLAANDGGNGTVDATGDLRFGGAERLGARVSLRATEAKLLRRDDVTASVSGELRYTGTAATGRVDGALTVMPIEAWLVDQLPPSVIVLPVIEIGGAAARQRAEMAASKNAVDWQAALDLTVDMPRRIFVRGRGLESEWAGLLRVTGTTAAPRVNGQISLVRGHYDFAGKRFVLTRGIITLFGNDGTEAIVDVAAERRTADLTAIITARGPAQNPEISLTANRDLPESEILSQVLFGKSSARLGPVEAVQLAGAVQALSSGRGVSDDAFSFVRTLLGVDTLGIGADETTGSPTLEAGRYVGDRVFIGGRQGVDPGTGAGTVAVEIAPGITLESELQQGEEEATGTIGLRWRWDY